jgi:hypothetical protein
MRDPRELPTRGLAKRSVLGLAVLMVAVASAAFGLWRESARAAETGGEAADPAPSRQAAVVYYFHGDARCPTCLAIERQTHRVVTNRFADELSEEALSFEVVNFDSAEGRHYRDRYDLAFGTVVVQAPGESGPWRNLSEVWTLIRAEPFEFEEYLVGNVRAVLESPR